MKKSLTYNYFKALRKQYPSLTIDMAVEREIDHIIETEDLDKAEFKLLWGMAAAMRVVDSDTYIANGPNGLPVATRIFG